MKGSAKRHLESSEVSALVNEHKWTVVSTDKPLKRLCECVLLSLRLSKEHKQPWSDSSQFSQVQFNMQEFSATFRLEYLSST